MTGNTNHGYGSNDSLTKIVDGVPVADGGSSSYYVNMHEQEIMGE